MTNPLTELITALMESSDKMEVNMVDRVTETSINGQLWATETSVSNGEGVDSEPFPSRKSRPNDHYCVAHSSLKTSAGGYRSSHAAVDYYTDLADKRKAELMEKLGKK